MVQNNDSASVAPTVLCFTPINKPSNILLKHQPAQVDSDMPLNRSPRKRQKNERLESLPSPPKIVRPRRKTYTKKTGDVRKVKTPVTAAQVSKRPPTSTTGKEPGILCERTKAKLNAFCYGNLPTPTTNTGMCHPTKENLLPKLPSGIENIEAYSDPNEGSDSTLSSDLWKNQQPLPEYPWLHGLYPKAIVKAEQAASVSDCQSEASVSLEQFLQPNAEIYTTQANNDMIGNEELEELLDGMTVDGRDNAVRRDLELDVGRELPKTCDLPDRDSHGFEDDFSMDENDLEILYESTCRANPSANIAAVTTERTSFQNIATQPQSQAFSPKTTKFHPGPPAEAITAPDYFKENEFEELGLEEMIDLLETSPETPIQKATAARDDIDCYSSDETLAFSPAASLHTTQESPLISIQPKQGIRSRFVRPPHPSALRTPSPIQGLLSEDRVLICFRVGEAVNATAKAQREGCKVLVELYARVLHSIRAGPVQTFRIVDLWSSPDKLGIVLEGRWVGWEKSELWKKDGEIFWEEGLQAAGYPPNSREKCYARKCRLIGSLERKVSGGYSVNILNLWEAAWDDIAFAKGLVCEPGEVEKLNK